MWQLRSNAHRHKPTRPLPTFRMNGQIRLRVTGNSCLQVHEFPAKVFLNVPGSWKPFRTSKVSRFSGLMLSQCSVNDKIQLSCICIDFNLLAPLRLVEFNKPDGGGLEKEMLSDFAIYSSIVSALTINPR